MPRAQVVQSHVASDFPDPGGKGDVSRLVFPDHPHQLPEDVLGDGLRLVMVLDQALHVAQDFVGVTEIEEAKRLRVPGLRPGNRRFDVPTIAVPLRSRRVGVDRAKLRSVAYHSCTPCMRESPIDPDGLEYLPKSEI